MCLFFLQSIPLPNGIINSFSFICLLSIPFSYYSDRDYGDGVLNMFNNDWNEFEGFFKSGRPEHIIDEASTDFKLQIEQHFHSLILHHSRPDAESPDFPNNRKFAITETCSKTLVMTTLALFTLIYAVIFAMSFICLLLKYQFMVDFYKNYSLYYFGLAFGLVVLIVFCECIFMNADKH